MFLKNIFNCGRTEAKNKHLKQEERKAMRWLINERRNNICKSFSQEEFDLIKTRVDNEFNTSIINHIYPRQKERTEVVRRMSNEALYGMEAIFNNFQNLRGDTIIYDLNIPAEQVLPLALARDEAQQELEKYMDNVIKDGRTTLTQTEFAKYKELKNKVDELESARLEALEKIELYKQANKEITKRGGYEEEYNFLFNTEPLSEDFLKKYFPSLRD